MNIGKSIRVACAQHDMSRQELSKKTGISTVTISKLSNDKANCKNAYLEKFAEVFQMQVSEFIALGE